MGPEGVTFSPSTIQLFAELLGQVSLSVQAPDFLAKAQQIQIAKDELGAWAEAQKAQIDG